ncbi:arginine--tRNA ligase [Balneolaceae bacterium ANBcel3]|nr:arginine--tRNA ligase [Balneolaceae bacterium ANBcel3]
MEEYLIEQIKTSILKINPEASLPEITIEKPRQPEMGDAATNVALRLGSVLKKKPVDIAREIADGMDDPSGYIRSVEVAGPGFINFRFDHSWLFTELKDAYEKEHAYGNIELNKGKKIQVEFVSANPTGPLTVGHGRNAVLGDTVARVFEWTGADVEREYYFNNAGRQMRVLAESVRARYLEQLEMDAPFPEGGYEGAYISDIARAIREEHGDRLASSENMDVFKQAAEDEIFKDIQRTLDRMNIKMDSFFNENELYKGPIDDVMKMLNEKGLIYEQDGATWLKTTLFGKDKDTVLIKSSGEPTYRLPDIAYHINKLDRSFDLVVDIFGADHIATYPDVISAVNACGYDAKKIDVVVYQFVTIVKDGKPFKMSTRKANFVTLDELMDEAGADVTRFFFLMRAPGTHLEFDIEEAKQAGEKNPVYYLQYAHARIKSIMRKALETQSYDQQKPDFSQLNHDSEITLIKRVLEFPKVIEVTAQNKEPHRIINYLNELATAFHKFYHDCRILGEAPELAHARIGLLNVTAHTLANGLTILGISAPDRM